MRLPRRAFGRTDMEITRVGLGGWAIGGAGWPFSWGPQDDDEAIATIRRAISSGVNWIDTAAVYGLGHSEELIGRAVRGIPRADRPYFFTKGGLVWNRNHPTAMPRRLARPDTLRQELQDSMRRYGVDLIDLYQVHWSPEDGTPIEEYWGGLVELRSRGLVRAIGLSNHDVADLERAERVGHVDAVQPQLSMLARSAAIDVIPWAQRHEVGVITYSPMHCGLLSGTFTEERAAHLGADDWRSSHPDFTGDGLRRNLRLVDVIRPIARSRGVSIAHLCVSWVLAWPGVTAAIVGARQPRQIDEWIGAGDLALSAAELDLIASALEEAAAGAGPTSPPVASEVGTHG